MTEDKKTTTIMKDKDIVYVADVPEFIKYVIKARGLDPAKACVRIGMDAGAESLKIMASIFDPEQESAEDEELDDEDDQNSVKRKSQPQKLTGSVVALLPIQKRICQSIGLSIRPSVRPSVRNASFFILQMTF